MNDVEYREIIDRLRESKYSDLLRVLETEPDRVFTAKGRVIKSQVCRLLGWTIREYDDALCDLQRLGYQWGVLDREPPSSHQHQHQHQQTELPQATKLRLIEATALPDVGVLPAGAEIEIEGGTLAAELVQEGKAEWI